MGGLDRILWDHIDTLTLAKLNCNLSDDCGLFDKFTFGRLQYGASTTIKVNVPLGFLVEVHLNRLEFDTFECENVADSSTEGAQSMLV